MIKSLFALSVLLFVFTGCDNDRLADIATPTQMEDKDILFILPSIPEEFCYADLMAEITNEVSEDINGTDPQILHIQDNVDCSHYGYSTCVSEDMGIGENNKPQSVVVCISEDEEKVCLYLIGNEYRDVEGDTFDETCIMGYNRAKQ